MEIHCLAGRLWVTDGKGGERAIEEGRREVLGPRRKICIQAMAPSVFRIVPDPCAAAWNRGILALLSILLPARRKRHQQR